MFPIHLAMILIFLGLATPFKRLITDPSVVFSSEGVPLDTRYNESMSKSCRNKCLPSAPGCPKSIDGNPWVYFGTPPMCFLTGVTFAGGYPCKNDSSLNVQPDSDYGKCVPSPVRFRPVFNRVLVQSVGANDCPSGSRYSKLLSTCLTTQSFSDDIGR